MHTSTFSGLARSVSALLLALVTGLGLAACGNDSGDEGLNDLGIEDTQGPDDSMQTPSEEPTDVAPAYEGPYDAKFRDWVNDNDEANVAVTGKVKQVISDNAFTLAGEGGAEDLLVVSSDTFDDVQAGNSVTVTGGVHKAFDLPGVEDEIDVDFEDDNVFQGFDRDPYIQATQVGAAAPTTEPSTTPGAPMTTPTTGAPTTP